MYDGVSEYCFRSLFAQSWQYRDRWGREVGNMRYSYRMTLRVLYFELFEALYNMQNVDDKIHPGRDLGRPTSEFRPHNWIGAGHVYAGKAL